MCENKFYENREFQRHFVEDEILTNVFVVKANCGTIPPKPSKLERLYRIYDRFGYLSDRTKRILRYDHGTEDNWQRLPEQIRYTVIKLLPHYIQMKDDIANYKPFPDSYVRETINGFIDYKVLDLSGDSKDFSKNEGTSEEEKELRKDFVKRKIATIKEKLKEIPKYSHDEYGTEDKMLKYLKVYRERVKGNFEIVCLGENYVEGTECDPSENPAREWQRQEDGII